MIREFSPNFVEEEIAKLRSRIRSTEWPDFPYAESWSFGSDLAYMKRLARYWAESFDFGAFARSLADLSHFRAAIDGSDIHFLHARSPHESATPLIVTHGWPSTFLEIVPLIGRLTYPELFGGETKDAFHVVIPSLPGFGFSAPPPDLTGYQGAVIADRWAQLMGALGYEKFLASGGDVGARVTAWLGARHGDRVMGIHVSSNALWPEPPKGIELRDDARNWVERRAKWADDEGGYFHVQRTKPLSLAYGLADSPVGLAAWIVEKWRSWSDCGGDIESRFSMEELLGHITLYWLTRTISTSLLPYHVYDRGLGARPLGSDIKVPVAFYLCEAEIGGVPPRSLAEKQYKIMQWTVLPRGGHFTATEEPDLLAADLREFRNGVARNRPAQVDRALS